MRVLRLIVLTFGAIAVFSVIVLTLVLWLFSRNLPKIETLADYQPPLATRVFDEDGRLIAEYADEHRILVPFARIPKKLIQAFLAAEDQQFYEHPGINPARIISALIANIRAGHVVQGGSTITQQVAKNFFLSPKKTLMRKIREAILAWKIEQRFTKDEILWLYLNQIYLGRGAYGVASAAWRYFGKTLDELTLAECAMLAGLPKAPTSYAPHAHPKKALARRNTVLRLMHEAGFISEEEMKKAMREPLVVRPLFQNTLIGAYENRVYEELVRRFGANAVRRGGLVVIVPYRAEAQRAAQEAVRRGILAIEERTPYRYPERVSPEAIETKIEELATQWEALADPPPPTQPFRAVITARHGRTLVAADGRHRWKIAAPDWAWETPEEDVARDPERYQRPPRWQPGDLVWLRMDEEDHVRLTQRTDLEAALLAVDLERGTALARVGGFDFRFGGFDRVGRARRQPGSALKPFLYATAIEYGWTPASIVIDAPVVFDNPEEGDFWRPENYARRFAGPVTLRNALEHSRNLASVRLLMDLGIQRFADALEQSYAFKRRFPQQLALALGAVEVSPEELIESYLVIASGGLRWKPVWIEEVRDRHGQVILRAAAGTQCARCHTAPVIAASPTMQPAERVHDPASMFLITNMMKGVIEHGTGRAARALGRPAAGKTGTTNRQVDAWFVGFTPQVLTGVWVGRDGHTPIGPRETGAHAALPIWLEAMRAFHKGLPVQDFTPPPGIVWAPVDADTGKPPTPESRRVILEAFREGEVPKGEEAPR